MAKKSAVWGIDIGQVALKALRCTLGDGPGELIADRFDYIEFPKMLNQPEAEPEQMIRDALRQFLSRNDVRGDKVAIRVPGQSGLSRFFRPPPVEEHTLPDIVKYEVKQQIPFPIEDVIWDWQQLGGMAVEDRMVDAEVGLFAMKREAVFRALKPFDEANVEVDLVQLSPLAVFNYITHDVLENVPKPEDFDPENPPDSVVVISLGTDTTDLIVTNGIKLWLRNIPVGGNHFTKQLSRELKLTHAKAEQLKRNARQAEDPKQIFKAMRPVFNDLVNEIQRSLTFFKGIDKTAKISKIVLLGNSANLPGLRQFLNQQLEMDIAKVTEFRHLTGAEVMGEKSFEENMLSFAPAYGLCLQGLHRGQLKTNLLPGEIQTERIVRAKKPWVLAALSLMMLGMLGGYKFQEIAYYRVSNDYKPGTKSWSEAKNDALTQVQASRALMESDNEQRERLDRVNRLNGELTSSSENKTTWIEFGTAIYQALPKDPRIEGLDAVDPNKIPYEDREEIYIDHLETEFLKDAQVWYAKAKPIYDSQFEKSSADDLIQQAATVEQVPTKSAPTTEVVPHGVVEAATENPSGLSGPCWIVEIKGHHYHNSTKAALALDAGKAFLLRTIIKKIDTGELELPDTNEKEGGGKFKYEDFGIYLPTIVSRADIPRTEKIVIDAVDNPNSLIEKDSDALKQDETKDSDDKSATPPKEGEDKNVESENPNNNVFTANRYDFVIQFAWTPRTAKERIKARNDRLARENAAATGAAAGDATSQPETPANATPPVQPETTTPPVAKDEETAPK
jgi:type IV pilus assembly protein PilM